MTPTPAQIEAAANAFAMADILESDLDECIRHALTAAADVGEPDNPHSGVPVDLMINDAVDAAIAATIERCAQVADEYFEATGWASKIAAAIRALK